MFVYTIKTLEDCFGFTHQSYSGLRDKFMAYYNTTNLIPTKYRCINKEPKRRRHVTNMKELIETLNQETNINWDLIPNDYSNTSRVAIIFATTKLIVIPCGSITFNMFYMHPYTGMMIILPNRCDYSNFLISYMLGISAIGQIHPHIPFVGGTGGPVNISEVVRNVFRLIIAIETREFPRMPHYCKVFNMSKIKTLLDENPYQLLSEKMVTGENETSINE